jgi:cytochrome c-type biogenesis protein CcmE
MKKIHIIALVAIAVAVGAIVSTLSDSSTYVNFSDAFKNPGSEYHVVGVLNRDKDMIYNPEVDANLFTFYMIDNNGEEKYIKLYKSKPQDFERSEQIVLIGKAGENDEAFHAREILMKCPSKYNEENGSEFKTEDEMREIRNREQEAGVATQQY